MQHRWLWLVGVVLALGCTPNSNTTPDASTTVTPPPPPPPGSPCAQACANLRALGCKSGFSIDGGQSCEVVCNNAMGTVPITFDFKPACLTAAKSKADVQACRTAQCP